MEIDRQTEFTIEVNPMVQLVYPKRGVEKKSLQRAFFNRWASNLEVKGGSNQMFG